jgi:hypothetical protein
MHLLEDVRLERPARVDLDKGIVYGVKILGPRSNNGREYSPNAMAQAAKFYEGLGVNLDHPSRDNPDEDRPVGSRFGVLRNVAVRPGGVYGNLHYLKTHPNANQIVECAMRFPALIGMSHNAEGKVRESENGHVVVESIEKVRSVDLVQNPACASSLFESQRFGNPSMKESESMTTMTTDLREHFKALISAAKDSDLPADEKSDLISMVLAFKEDFTAALSGDTADDDEPVEESDENEASVQAAEFRKGVNVNTNNEEDRAAAHGMPMHSPGDGYVRFGESAREKTRKYLCGLTESAKPAFTRRLKARRRLTESQRKTLSRDRLAGFLFGKGKR